MAVATYSVVEMRRKRARLADEARGILKGNESLSPEDKRRWDSLMAEVDQLGEQIEREERMHTIERSLDERTPVLTAALLGQEYGESRSRRSDPAVSRAFRTWMGGGMNALDPEERSLIASRQADMSPEMRALSAVTDGAGGYTVPEDFVNRIEKAMKAFGGMREAGCTIIPSDNGQNLPLPMGNDTGNEGAIYAENTQIDEQDTTFTQAVLGAHMYTSKIVRVPIQLIQDTGVDIEAHLAEILAERVGRPLNRHLTVGTGTGQPQGVVTAATLGVTGTTVAGVGYDDLVDLEHSVDTFYRNRPAAGYMFHDTTLKVLRKLKDLDERPLWAPGVAFGQPDRLNGRRYTINNDMPELAASAKSILFGDFSKYHIRDVKGYQLFRFGEKYMDYLQIGFLGFSRHDGKLADAGTNPIKFYQNAAE